MGQNVKEHLRLALRMMLKPLVKLLISQGVTHGDFAEAAKDVYVEVSIRHFDKGARVNQSRIAIMTGLTRKEVKNVINRAISAEPDTKNYSRPSRVLAGWHSDPKYIGPYGVPLEIPYESAGVEGPSFVNLVRTYSGDMAPRPMLKELIRVGAVVELENSTFKAARRDFEPEALSPELVERLGKMGHYFFSTTAANIEKAEQGSGYFDRRVFTEEGLAPESIREFDTYIKRRGQEFLEELDNWFVATEKRDHGKPKRQNTGLCMIHYVVNEEDEEDLRDLLVERGLEINSQRES
ncbi:MAG: DUF6502 family protein [Gammaproteobacteria bacterium]|nr:DUF6502 family protein [Gammaproteobacteria bacterium]